MADLSLNVVLKDVVPTDPIQVRMDPEVCGATRQSTSVIVDKRGGLKDVVAWVEGNRVLGWPPRERSETPTLRLKNCDCEPHVLVVQPKETIKILNEDPILHSLRAQGQKNYPVFRVHPPNLIATFMRFTDAEIVQVYSDLHPWMRASVVVAPHQNYAITDKNGDATISSIPLGKVRLKLWHSVMGLFEYPDTIEIRPKMDEIKIVWTK